MFAPSRTCHATLLRVSTLLVLAATCGACAKASAPAPMEVASPSSTAAAEKTSDSTKQAADGKAGLVGEQAAQVGRKVIRNGELSVRVDDYAKAAIALQSMVDACGGFVQDLQVDHSVESVSSATWLLRVPSSGLDQVLGRLRRLGRVTQEHIGAEDVTEAYTDLQARLSNAVAAEARLRQLLDKPEHALKDVLEVERELSRARENVEVLEGRKRLLDSRIDLATLKVTLSVAGKYVPPVDPTLGDRIEEAWWNSLDTLGEASQGLVVLLVAVAPWLTVLALIGWVAGVVIRALVQRLSRRGRTTPPPAVVEPPQNR